MGKKLFIGGLSWNIDERQLEDSFKQFGPLSDVKVITDRETGRSRGFGFVTFENTGDADTACSEMDGVELDGRTIKVSEAQQKRDNRNFRSGGGGNQRNNRW